MCLSHLAVYVYAFPEARNNNSPQTGKGNGYAIRQRLCNNTSSPTNAVRPQKSKMEGKWASYPGLSPGRSRLFKHPMSEGRGLQLPTAADLDAIGEGGRSVDLRLMRLGVAAQDLLPRYHQPRLLENHNSQEVCRLGPLLLSPRLAPVQFLGHNIDETGQGLKRRIDVEESKTGTARDDIGSGASGLTTNAMSDLGLDEGER